MTSFLSGDISTQPNSKIVFNAPYDIKHTYHIKIINASGRRIGWVIKAINMKRLGVGPACGRLDPKEATLMTVSCDVFDYGREDTNDEPLNLATPPIEPPSSSDASGSRKKVWSAERIC